MYALRFIVLIVTHTYTSVFVSLVFNTYPEDSVICYFCSIDVIANDGLNTVYYIQVTVKTQKGKSVVMITKGFLEAATFK